MIAPPELSVIVVNWNTRELLRQCLTAVERTTQTPHRLLVVDNGSMDDSVAMVRTECPAAAVLANPTNRGFAAAVNQALRQSTSPFVLLLNSDTAVQPGTLDALVDFLRQHPRVGMCGCRLRDARGLTQLSFGRWPTIWTEAVRKWLWNPLSQQRWGARWIEHRYRTPTPVDWVLGACLMIRRTAIDQIGLLDERFYFYFEEVDWCRRAIQAGWSVVYVPTVEVMHLGGQSVARDPARLMAEYRKSQRRFYQKHHAPWQQWLLRCYLAGKGALMRVHPAMTAAAIAGVIAILALAPMSLHPATTLYAYAHPGDAMGSMWTTWVRLQALSGHLDLARVPWIVAPTGVDLRGYPPEPVTEWPLLLLARWIGEVAAFNLLMLLTFPLAAAAMALLVHHLTRSSSAAIFSGLLYAFTPYHFAHTMHLGLGAVQWLPLALWSGIRLREQPTAWRATLHIACCLLVFWATIYYGLLLAIVWCVLIAGTRRWGGAPQTYRAFIGWWIVAVLATIVGTSVWFHPFLQAAGVARWRDVAHVNALYGRPLKDLFVFAAKPWDYLLPSIHNPFLGPWIRPFIEQHLYGSNVVEQSLYLGFVPLALALVAWRSRRCPDVARSITAGAIPFFVILATAGLIWSAPPYVPLGRFHIQDNQILSAYKLWFPSGVVYPFVPFLRVYARFGLLAILAISVLAGLGWHAVKSPRFRVVLALVAAAELSVVAPSWDIRTAPAVYTWLAAQPPGTIIEYPFCKSTDSVHAEYLFWQRIHRHPMVNGNSAGNAGNPNQPDMANIVAPWVPQQLQRLGVTYVIIHRDKYHEVARAPRQLHVLGVDYTVPIRVETLFNAPDEKFLDIRFQSIPHSKITFGETTVYQLREHRADHRH